MLRRSFKPAKCKTALQMASSRLKILKNKKDVQIKQLKRELAQLLESGQDQTARIRVEHVLREEKTMAAYELIGIYCELLVARMAVIESQKNCPTDLKEAVACVVFASRRCADVPELMDVLKHFTAKYGKEFVSAAVEVRPDCGVSRLLIEKLSAKAPDGPTKIKILSAIAEEHNIKWEHKSFGEPDSKSPEDLLSGPNTFEAASKLHVYPPRAQDTELSNVQALPVVNVPPRSTKKQDPSANPYAPDERSPSHPQNFAASGISVNKTSADTIHPNTRPSGAGTEEMEYGHPYSGDGNVSPMSRDKWNMEFKDATAAARVAAESAERAKLAARAAIELSRKERIMRQDSTGSRSSFSYGLRNEPTHRYGGSKLHSEHLAEDQSNNSPAGRNSMMQYEDMGSTRHDNPSGECQKDGEQKNDKLSWAETSKSWNEEESEDYRQMAGRYSRKNSSGMSRNDSFGKSGVKVQRSESDINIGYSEEVRMRKQSSRASSRSHSSTFSDEHSIGSDLNSHRSQNDLEENVFATNDGERLQSSTKEVESDDDHAVHFDDYGSFDDKPKFDAEDAHDEQEYGLGFGLPGQDSPAHRFTDINAGIFSENQEPQGKHSSQSHFLTEKHSSPLFDDISTSPAIPLPVDDLSTAKYDDYSPESDSDEELEKVEAAGHKSLRFPVAQEMEEDFFPPEPDEAPEDSSTSEESCLESHTDDDYTSTKVKQSSFSSSIAKSSISSGTSTKEPYNEKLSIGAKKKSSSRLPDPSFSDNTSEEEFPRQDFSKSQEQYSKQTGTEDSKRSNSKTPTSYLHFPASDDEGVPRNPSNVKARPNIGFSRRTRPQPKISERPSFSKTTVSSAPPVSLKDVEQGSLSSSSYDAKTEPKPWHHASFRPSSESKRPSQDENSKSSAKPQPSGSLPKITTSASTESSNTCVETPSKDKATHVHPKLPDYDDLLAKFGSNRR